MPDSNDKITVVVADDHDGILKMVSEVLAGEFDVIAAVNGGLRAVEAAAQLKPDIMILDISMPDIDGFQAAREIRRLGLTPKLIFLSVQEDDDYIRSASTMGASYVRKPRMHLDLAFAAREILAGRTFFSPLSRIA